jgi:uncharacterized tellurite resistance protein B-like protein
MFDRLRVWLEEAAGEHAENRDALQTAVAALLVETARVDDRYDARERDVIDRLLAQRFGLQPGAAHELQEEGAQRASRSVQLFGYARTINERLPRERRVGLIEMLWEVAYADGVLDPLEDSLVRQVGGLIDVTDQERGAARRRVMERLGIEEPG